MNESAEFPGKRLEQQVEDLALGKLELGAAVGWPSWELFWLAQPLADLHAQGRDWAEIAAALGGTAQGRRKQLARAIDRVAKELRLEGAL